VIIAGASAYSRAIDFKKFREIADDVGAILMCDVAHYAGLIVAASIRTRSRTPTSSPPPRTRPCAGPRGGLILTNDKKLRHEDQQGGVPRPAGRPADARDRRQGGGLRRGAAPEFKTYAKQVIENARALADSLQSVGFKIVSNGTDSHLMLVDLTPKSVSGRQAEIALERAGITTNKNSIPGDPLPPMQTSGLRVGTPAGTTRGFGPRSSARSASGWARSWTPCPAARTPRRRAKVRARWWR
jgi:glycine hydroxymethyltransferase